MTRIIARESGEARSDRGGGVSRRMALRALAAMGLGGVLPHAGARADNTGAGGATAVSARERPGPRGDLTDPDLRQPIVPWERTLPESALETLESLVELILPADERSPGAAALGAHEFIDEWVSAPYPSQRRDRELILAGLDWLDAAAAERFGARFAALQTVQQTALCDLICYLPDADPGDRAAAEAFARARDLTAAAFWTTEAGMSDLQYVGNLPQADWGPPPRAVLAHLGLT